MTRRLFLAVVLAVLGCLLLAAGAPGQLGAPARTAIGEPETTILTGPPDPSSSSIASFTYSSDDPLATFECSRDGALFTNCPSSGKTYNGLLDGPHTFSVQATGALGTDLTPATYGWTISTDSTLPDTTITSGPSGTTPSASATFTFTSTEAGSTFECRRDTQAFSSCSSTKSYSGLPNGPHTFYVRATDPSDNTDATPASRTWTVVSADSVPPETTITSGPVGTTSSTSATFTFASSEAGSTFECSRNLAAFTPCTSPTTYSALADGTHTFNVRATDPSDNTDATPATATWTVASNTTGVPTVTDLRAIAGDHRVRLVWKKPTGIGIRRIEIRRGSGPRPVYRGPGTEFIDTRVFNGRTYTYSIVVVDDLGNTSPAAGVFARPHGKLLAPRDGGTVLRPPMLRWLPRARATYYNVQLFRNGQKVLSRWPARPRLQLRMQWRSQSRLYRLRDARYVWYVFPGFGKRPANRYGKVIGHSTFIKR